MALGRMNILFLIRKAVMMPMMGYPPQGPALDRRVTHNTKKEPPKRIGNYPYHVKQNHFK
jgi:hypothetical protein